MVNFLALIQKSLEFNASDLILIPGSNPVIRANKELMLLPESEMVTAKDTKNYFEELVEIANKTNNNKETLFGAFSKNKEVTFSLNLEQVARIRVNIHLQRQTIALAIRFIPTEVPSAENLNLPSIIYELCELDQGLILTTGPSGNGTTTTLAVMLNIINRNQKKHIITIENPIEYIHKNTNSYIEQREIGVDCDSITEALKNVLKQNPDIIFVSELNDAETINWAISAAEAGHLVLSSLSTSDSMQTLHHIISMYSSEQQSQIRCRLAYSLKAIISQRLVPALDGQRVLATEILKNNYSIGQAIIEGKIAHIPNIIENSKAEGMHLLAQDMINMIQNQQISFQTAFKYCNDIKYFEKLAQELLKDN